MTEQTKITELVSKKYKKQSRTTHIFRSLIRSKSSMAGLIIFALMFVAFIASLLISWDSIVRMNPMAMYAKPSWEFPFGADNFGRNLFLRVIYGTRYTFAIGLGAVSIAGLIGISVGSFAGFYGGRVEDVIMRCTDALSAIPGILLGMVIVTVLGQSLQNLIIAVGIQATPIYIRMTRASVSTVRNAEFVESAKAVGFSDLRIIFTKVLPNGLAPIIVTATTNLGAVILVASSLSFLGLGVPYPHPEWGFLTADARLYSIHAPHLMMFPGLFIMLTVLAFNMLGDGLRDALDPKMKR